MNYVVLARKIDKNCWAWHFQIMIAPPNVLRAARELLCKKQVDVAQAAGISRSSVQRVESGESDRTHTSIVLQTYYENEGIVFVRPGNGQGWGLIDNSSDKLGSNT
jgi:transcriptional regulator with XRE-family HTH domain